MTLSVRPARSRADLSAVLDLPYRLYEGDPCFVPFLRFVDRRRMRSFMNTGDLVLFLAERDGRVVGTISALRDRGYEKSKGEKVAWFGFFECENDQEVARALFESARSQAREWGCERLRGPRNLTRMEWVGMTVEGHDELPPFMQGHHLRYYPAMLEALGFEKHHDVLAYDISLFEPDGSRKEIPAELQARADACDLPGLVVRPSARRHLSADLIAAHSVLNTAFVTVPDVSPMPRAAFVSLGRTYLAFADPNMLQLATIDGKPVGFAACFPELNEALVHVGGRLLPLGWARLIRGLRHVHTASFKLIGVNPEYRGSGLHAKLIVAVVEGARAAGYSRIEGSVIDERNGPMRGVVEGIGMEVYRRYRFFDGEV